MRKTGWFLAALFIIIGCSSGSTSISSNGTGGGNSSGSGSGNSSGNEESQKIQATPLPEFNANPVNIMIPSFNETAPDGILQQLAWGAIGGGEGGKPPCGECDIDLDESSIIMRDFSPLQELGLGFYRRTGFDECGNDTADFVTSVNVQVDRNGYLAIPIGGATDRTFIAYAIDLNTNKVVWKAGLNIYSYIKCPLLNDPIDGCTGAPPQRLKVNEMAYVCTKSDTVKLREGPGKNYTILRSLVPGAELKIIGGPKCANNWSWWEVETESGYRGWMSEGGDSVDKYFLCPSK